MATSASDLGAATPLEGSLAVFGPLLAEHACQTIVSRESAIELLGVLWYRSTSTTGSFDELREWMLW